MAYKVVYPAGRYVNIDSSISYEIIDDYHNIIPVNPGFQQLRFDLDYFWITDDPAVVVSFSNIEIIQNKVRLMNVSERIDIKRVRSGGSFSIIYDLKNVLVGGNYYDCSGIVINHDLFVEYYYLCLDSNNVAHFVISDLNPDDDLNALGYVAWRLVGKNSASWIESRQYNDFLFTELWDIFPLGGGSARSSFSFTSYVKSYLVGLALGGSPDLIMFQFKDGLGNYTNICLCPSTCSIDVPILRPPDGTIYHYNWSGDRSYRLVCAGVFLQL